MKTYKRQPFTFDRVVRILITIGFFVGFFLLINYLSGALIPFVIATLLAYIINPLVEFYQKKLKMSRNVGITSSMFSIFLVMGLLAWLLIPMINREFMAMGEMLSEYLNKTGTNQYFSKEILQKIEYWASKNEIKAIFEKADYSAIFEKIYPKVSEIFTGSVNILLDIFSIVIIFLYLIFILVDYEKVMQGWKKLIPPQYRPTVVALVRDFNKGMNQYFRAQALVALIVGILFAIGFQIIGLPLAIVLGLFIGALNMIPYLQTVGFIPAFFLGILHAIEHNMSIWVVFGLILLVFAVVQLIQEAILIPKIMGKVTGLSPVIIILSLSIWGTLLGMLGLLIALPITTLIQAYYFRYLQRAEFLEKRRVLKKEKNMEM